MQEQLQETLRQLRESVSAAQGVSALTLVVNLIVGGFLALYLRWLYSRCSSSPSDTDSITRVFPLLTVVTAGVIAVVKSSLALSLGLVGALSIVRFRAAIKEPEELVYLFLCISVGLSIGAGQPLIAVCVVAAATFFIVGMHAFGRRKRTQKLMLTITGDSDRHFGDRESGVWPVVDELAGRYTLQRLDIENGRGQVRIAVPRTSTKETAELIYKLRQRLPECELSYVNIDSTL